MKILLLIFIFAISIATKAQITKIEVQASGLTCSMCNKSIHKALTSVQNVKNVDADLNTNTFTITFKDSAAIDLDNLKVKIEKAGYKVANFWLHLNVSNIVVKKNAHTPQLIDNNNFHFINIPEQNLNGIQKLQLVDKGFVSNKVYKKYEKLIATENCIGKTAVAGLNKTYHLTL
jgi:copper chaperone CopZ